MIPDIIESGIHVLRGMLPGGDDHVTRNLNGRIENWALRALYSLF